MEIDPFIGEFFFFLSPTLGILGKSLVLSLSKRPGWLRKSSIYWFLAKDLGLHGQWAMEWTTYIDALNRDRISLNDNEYMLVWRWNKTIVHVTSKETYNDIIMHHFSK